MNLRVDLILEDEKRSGSAVSLKSIIRIATFAVPVIILVMGLVAVMNTLRINLNVRNMEKRWEIASVRMEEAQKLEAEFIANRNILKEINGWRASHIDWHQQLLAIQRVAPYKTQLQTLRTAQTFQLVKNRFPSRNFTISLKGKAVTGKAGLYVNNFKNALESADALKPLLESVNVAEFAEDTSEGADRLDRIFRIECVYKPCEFQEPAKAR